MTLPSATELLAAWDSQRPRSLQKTLGMSALGGCRRRAGYIAQGFDEDPGFDKKRNIQAILGTAVHEALVKAAKLDPALPPGSILDDAVVEFAGVTGHPDLFVEPVLRDFKTIGYATQLAKVKARGPSRQHRWQVAFYAAALILAGYQVQTVEIDYIVRDSGEEYIWSGPFSMDDVRDAMAWLKIVRETPAGKLTRDFRPDSGTCAGCPFFQRCWQKEAVPGRNLRTVLYKDWPNAADWVELLEATRESLARVKEQESDAKGALDALRTVTEPGESELVEVPGLDGKLIRFTVTWGKRTLDAERITADYARVGAEVPMRTGEPGVKVSVVARP